MKILPVLILVLFGTPYSVFTQANNSENLPFCATPDFKYEKLIYYQQNLENYRFLTDDSLFVPIKLHMLGNDDGVGYANIANVLRAFCILNENFEQPISGFT